MDNPTLAAWLNSLCAGIRDMAANAERAKRKQYQGQGCVDELSAIEGMGEELIQAVASMFDAM